jgi:Mycothiol maleylpyruvate isomerase N-terminal domain
VKAAQTKEDKMGAKGEALAKQFESKAEDARTVLEKLTDADWKKTTAAEKWTVGVTAHHLATSYERVPQIINTIATGQSMPHFTPQMLDQMNAKHAEEFAGCTRAEVLALHKKGAVSAAAALRNLSDEQVAKSGTVFAGLPPMTVEQLALRALINHTDEHYGSIRKTIGG